MQQEWLKPTLALDRSTTASPGRFYLTLITHVQEGLQWSRGSWWDKEFPCPPSCWLQIPDLLYIWRDFTQKACWYMRKWTAFLPRCVSGIYANPLLQGSTSLPAPWQLALPALTESYFKSTLSAVAPIRCSPHPSSFCQQDLSQITTSSFLLQPSAVFPSVCFVLWEASQEFSATFMPL